MNTAKIFWSGRSQAVRLPKNFRFDATTVRIRKHGNKVILEPVAENWAWLYKLCGKIDHDFSEALKEPQEQQSRPALDEFFE